MMNATTDDTRITDDAPADAASQRPTQPAGDQPLSARVEALLLACDRPMSDGKIAELLGITLEEGGSRLIRDAIDTLNREYEEAGRAFRIEQVAGGRQMLTLPAFGSILHRLHQDRLRTRLTPAAMETLAIVAYRQPILRADIEAIRGVASGEVVRGLMERRLVKIVGRAEELGRPMLYGTTREFLRIFGLASLDDLPQAKELREVRRRSDEATERRSDEGGEEEGDQPARRQSDEAGEDAAEAAGQTHTKVDQGTTG